MSTAYHDNTLRDLSRVSINYTITICDVFTFQTIRIDGLCDIDFFFFSIFNRELFLNAIQIGFVRCTFIVLVMVIRFEVPVTGQDDCTQTIVIVGVNTRKSKDDI